MFQRFVDPDELILCLRGLHRGLLGSAYRAVSWGAALVFGSASMGMFVDAMSVGVFLRRMLAQLARIIARRIYPDLTASWSEWEVKWAEFGLSALTMVCGAVAGFHLYRYEHFIGTSLLGATAVATTSMRIFRRCFGEDTSTATGTGHTFCLQIMLALLGIAAQVRLKSLRKKRPSGIFRALDRIILPLVTTERMLKRYTEAIFSLQFNT